MICLLFHRSSSFLFFFLNLYNSLVPFFVCVCVCDYSMSLRDPLYDPPSVSELQEFLLADRRPTGHVNQVWPHVYIGNESVHTWQRAHTCSGSTYTYSMDMNVWSCFRVAARDKATLHSLGITHIVNAAHGRQHVNTGPRFYRDMPVDYYGVEADDATDFILSPFFYPIARYIRAALAMGGKSDLSYLSVCDWVWKQCNTTFNHELRVTAKVPVLGRVFVHCLMGVSRSATLVLAFLMIVEGLTLQEAVAAVRPHRDICPNPGFLQQLRSLDMSLERERRRRRQAQTL